MKSLIPYGKRILVMRSVTNKTASGLLLPDNAKNVQRTGFVIQAGSGMYEDKKQPYDVKPGDTVFFGAHAGIEVTDIEHGPDEQYLLLSENEILGIVEE